MYRQSLAIDLKVFGPDHPKVATTYNNLASLLQDDVSTNPEIALHRPPAVV